MYQINVFILSQVDLVLFEIGYLLKIVAIWGILGAHFIGEHDLDGHLGPFKGSHAKLLLLSAHWNLTSGFIQDL